MQELISFIKINLFNKKGYIESQRVKESWINKRHPKIWNKYKRILSNKELFYKFTIKHNIITEFDSKSVKNTAVFSSSGICRCGNKTHFANIRKGYKKYCSASCAGKFTSNTEKVKQTKLEKYNDKNYNNSAKNKQTLIEKYGVYKVMDIPGVKEKQKVRHRKTNEESGFWVKLKDKKDYEIYKYYVQKETMKHYKQLPNSEKRGNHAYNKNAYHIDHIFPIKKGFYYNIPPYIIGSLSNLEMIPWLDNISKKDKININSLEDLYERWSKSFI